MVDACFAANRRVNLRQQSGWHLDKRRAALIARRRKPGHIPHHAPAKRNDRRPPVVIRLQQSAPNTLDNFERFVLLAVGKNHITNVKTAIDQLVAHRIKVEGSHHFVGHNKDVFASDVACVAIPLTQ